MIKLFKRLLPIAVLALLSSCVNKNAIIEEVKVTDVSFSISEEYLEMGSTYKMTATVSPSNATNKKVTWSSSDKSVATISSKGKIKPVSAGETTIKVASKENPAKYAECHFTVVNQMIHPRSVTIDANQVTIERGESKYLNTSFVPSDTSNKKIVWTASNDNVTVDINGRVTGRKVGNSVVTAKTVDGGILANCSVTVTETSLDQWTVLIYMCGSNLESEYANETQIYYEGQYYEHDGVGLATADIMEILAVPNKPDDVNIVIETGGAREWTTRQYANYGTYDISSTRLQRHHVENNKIVLDQSMTYSSMGLKDTLKDFVKYGLNNYPAHKTALILWNHGGGLQGACFDEKKNNDGIEPFELTSAVSGALSDVGRTEKLEFVGYDCCLMQVQDIANINSQYFNYMVTSQETESGTGWDYNTWIDDLYAYKDTTEILKAIADGFIRDNGGVNNSRNDQTLSYLNLNYMENYRVAWENMAGQLLNAVSNNNKKEFNRFVSSGKKYAGADYSYYGLFDSKNFIERLETSTSFAIPVSYLTAVRSAHAKLVEYSICGRGAGKSYGLSMFWNISSMGWGYTTYSYNGYSASYGFPNWDNLNYNFGAATSSY